jgi:hypothetical protein
MSESIVKEAIDTTADKASEAVGGSFKNIYRSHKAAAIGLAGACVLAPFQIIRTNCILNNQAIPDILNNL